MPYTDQDKENDRIVGLCYKYLDNFKNIYIDGKEENPIPKHVKLTVFCKSSDNEGFLINLEENQLGIEALIAKKWILHSELEKIAGFGIP